ncbi:MAG: hypothetical protein WCG98_07945, partial [bacterium]
MYSTAILQPFHDKKNPAMRDDMVMKLYEANKYSRDELKDPTDSEINKFYTNAADAKYFKAHINDIKKIFGERRKTEQYVATTKSILMRRKCMFPDVDNATTREFLALRDSKVSAAQNTINFYQKRIANQEGEKSVADREWQKARSELTYATKDTGHMSPSEYKAYTNNINSLKAKQIEAYQKSAKIGSEIGRIKKEVNIFVKEDMSKMMDELNQEYVNTIIKLNNYNIGQIQKIGKIASPFGSNVQLDFG